MRNSTAVARRLIEPLHETCPPYSLTFGPEVADVCAGAGFAPDPYQERELDKIFAVDELGRCAIFEYDLVAARQQIKTGLILMSEIGWLYVTQQRLIVHSAHELSTTEEAFTDLKNIVTNSPALSRRLAPGPSHGIFEGNGRWSIQLAPTPDTPRGQRIKYKARTKGGGRGLTGDKIVLDEGFALMPTHMGALLPTLTVVPDPQVITASSAGKAESDVLRDKRDRGRERISVRQGYTEYGDAEAWSGCKRGDKCDHAKTTKGCALDDEARWARILTALGTRCTLDTIRAMRQAMPPLEFAREFMVWWDETGDDSALSIDQAAWLRQLNVNAPSPRSAALAIDVAPGMGSASIALAGKHGKRITVIVRHGEGVGWVVKAVRKLCRKLDVHEITLCAGNQSKSLKNQLDKAEIEYTEATAGEVGAAFAELVTYINEGRVEHVGQAELDKAVATAKPAAGNSERPDRRDRSIDLTPVVSAAVAVSRAAAAESDDYDPLDSIQ